MTRRGFSFGSAEQLVFWSGAGTSANPPSSLPLGDALTRAVIDHACGSKVRRQVFDLIAAAQMVDSTGHVKTVPRLEAVLQPLIATLTPRIALLPLSVVDAAPPNNLHEVFGAHLAAGGRHITTNFDSCIERAAPAQARVTHLHGRYERDRPDAIAADLTQVGRGLSQENRTAIREALDGSATLVVCGYSGRDFFDVDPYWRELRSGGARFDGLTVLWISHTGDEPRREPWEQRPVEGATMLRCLADMGAGVEYWVGDTERFIVERFGGSREARSPRRVGFPLSELSGEDRLRATGGVWSLLGAGKPLLRLLRFVALDPRGAARRARPQMVAQRRVAHSGTGNYRRAIVSAWRLPGRTTSERAHRLQLVASDVRLRGQFGLAGVLHARSVLLYNAISCSTAAERGDRGDAAVEWLNWNRDLARFSRARAWFTRVAASRSGPAGVAGRDALAVPQLWRRLARDEAYQANRPHSIAQLERLRHDLPELRAMDVPAPLRHRAEAWEQAYVETDSIAGYINRRRQVLSAGLSAADAPAIELLARQSRLIGDRPGVLKAALMKRAHGFGGRIPGPTLLAVGWSWRYKALWLWCWLRRRQWPLG